MQLRKWSFFLGTAGIVIAATGAVELEGGMTLDLGTFPSEAPPAARAVLVNRGSNTVSVVKVESTCVCVAPIVREKKILPGGQLPVEIEVEPNRFDGPFEEGILVQLGGDEPTNLFFKVKGIARPPVSGMPRFLLLERLPVDREWMTNLTIQIREDLRGKPMIQVKGLPLQCELKPEKGSPRRFQITFRLLASPSPRRWKGRIETTVPGCPPWVSHVRLSVGGVLRISSHTISPINGRAELTLIREAPLGEKDERIVASLKTDLPGLSVEEKPLSGRGRSLVCLSLSPELRRRLKKEGKISFQLSVPGFFPVKMTLCKK